MKETLKRSYKFLTVLISFCLVFVFIPLNLFSAEELQPIKLTEPNLTQGKLLMSALKERQSTRSFSSKELSLDVLSNLLWAAFGINRAESGKRTAPSAMNWQEIEVYVAMKTGLYLYNSKENQLDPIMAKDIREFTGIQEFTQIAPVNLIFVADYSKMKIADNEKPFYAGVDTGYISQNVYLFCAAFDLATVVLGMVNKPELGKLMNLNDNQRIILTQPVGYKE